MGRAERRAHGTTIELNKAHWPVTVLGPGRRVGLWVQGCSIHCPGCVSQDTWPADPATAITIDALLQWCRTTTGGALDGVTISGGEPFDQPDALLQLLTALDKWRGAASLDFDILCYSGYPLRQLERRHAAILARLDAVIPEPYVDGLPLGGVWRGSANQSLVPLSPRGHARFGTHVDRPVDATARKMQMAVEGGRVWMIGIPARDDMARVEALCAERGLALSKVSWRR